MAVESELTPLAPTLIPVEPLARFCATLFATILREPIWKPPPAVPGPLELGGHAVDSSMRDWLDDVLPAGSVLMAFVLPRPNTRMICDSEPTVTSFVTAVVGWTFDVAALFAP